MCCSILAENEVSAYPTWAALRGTPCAAESHSSESLKSCLTLAWTSRIRTESLQPSPRVSKPPGRSISIM